MEKYNLLEISKKGEKILKKDKKVLFAYIFGSLACQKVNPDSDIDIAVFLNKETEIDFFNKRLELISELSQAFKKEADVLILNRASVFMKYVVLKEGRLIFSRDENSRIDFELKALNDYFDFKPYLEEYNKRTLNKL